MAISKLILNGVTQMDVTDTTTVAGDVTSGKYFYNSSGVRTSGNIAVKSENDITVSGATVTIPSGYYSSAVSKSVQGSADEWIKRSLAYNQENSTVTTIGSYAFAGTSIGTASFPNVVTIGSLAFLNCQSLNTISFPKTTMIGGEAFNYCSRLTTVYFPEVSYVDYSAFNYCLRLSSISFPKATYLSMGAFAYCGSLTTVTFPEVLSTAQYVFPNCSKLSEVYFPKLSVVASNMF